MPEQVLFLHSSAGLYGADHQLLKLAAGLDPARFNPLVVLPERGELAELLEAEGVEVLVEPIAVLRRAELGPAGALRLARERRAARSALRRLVHDRGVALVHSNTSVILSGHELGVPHVLHVRELYPETPVLWPLLRRRLMRADRLVCVSQAVARQFTQATVVHDGLPRVPERAERGAARAALGIETDRFVVALLGRISDWKGQDVLARALAEPELEDAVALIAGTPWPGAERPLHRLEDLRDQLGLGDRLRVLGFVPGVEAVLGAADAVAVPSTRPDPFPNSALEAAAAGLPVVAAAHGGLPEMIRDDETGLLVEPGDHVELARALSSLAEDPARAKRLGDAAAADVAARFPVEHMLERIQAIYDELLSA